MILSTVLLLTITGCVTTQRSEYELPPKPERESLPEVQTIKDVAKLVNYYESLVKEWERWGETVTEIMKNP